MASATAVWHQVKEEVMEIHSKLECRTHLDKQVCLDQQSIYAVHTGHKSQWKGVFPSNADCEGQEGPPRGQQLSDGCESRRCTACYTACRARAFSLASELMDLQEVHQVRSCGT